MAMLRLLAPLLALSLLLAGCLGATQPSSDEAAAPVDAAAGALPPTPVALEGRAWLPPSNSEERERTEIPFTLDAAGAAGTVDVRLGSSYGIDLPPLLASVIAQVLAPDGTVLAEATLGRDAPEATLELADLGSGDHLLLLQSYGGSGGGTGDYVDYVVALS